MQNKPRRRPTVHDVARVAGVSYATVSRRLNGHSNVATETAAAIDAAVLAVGYVPNGTARSLVRRRTHSVAFVVREHVDLFYSDPTLSRMAAGANLALAEQHYLMPLLIVDTADTERRVIDFVLGGSVDGAILVAMTTGDPVVQALRGSTVPVVTASTPLGDDTTPSVDTDNSEGTFTITDLLRRAGRRRIAEIRGPASMPVSALRHDGFRRALADDYDGGLVVDAAEWSFGAGAEAMTTLLDRGERFDALVAASDLIAAGAMSVLAARGIIVPDDVAVVGFDDSPIAMMTTPSITTVRQNSGETGRQMARLVMELVDGAPVVEPHVIVPNEVVWRQSAGARPK